MRRHKNVYIFNKCAEPKPLTIVNPEQMRDKANRYIYTFGCRSNASHADMSWSPCSSGDSATALAPYRFSCFSFFSCFNFSFAFSFLLFFFFFAGCSAPSASASALPRLRFWPAAAETRHGHSHQIKGGKNGISFHGVAM